MSSLFTGLHSVSQIALIAAALGFLNGIMGDEGGFALGCFALSFILLVELVLLA